jgi:hypothetical protein
MARTEPAEIYQLRAVLRGISPLIWRRLLVRGDSTLANLAFSYKPSKKCR